MIFPVKRLADLGFEIVATEGTAEVLRRNGVEATVVRKHCHGRGPDGEPTVVERILAGEVDIIVNTPYGVGARADGYEIRAAAVAMDVPCITTVQELAAAVQGIEALGRGSLDVRSLQELDRRASAWPPARARRERGTRCRSRGEVLSTKRVGDYHHLTLVAPGIAERTRPGHFVALAVGGPDSALTAAPGLLDLPVSSRGVYGGTVEIVLAVHGAGTAWLAAAHPHDPVDVVGPLGRPFACPRTRSTRCSSAAATAARRCSRWPSSCAAVAAGSTSCSAPPPRTGCSASSTPSGWPARSRSPPTTARPATGAGSPTCCPS